MSEQQIDLLGMELYRLAVALRESGVPLIIGGGYGLVLRKRHLDDRGVATLRAVPPSRATEDLDVFLTAELIADGVRVEALRDSLRDLGFEPVDSARYYQFRRDIEYRGFVRTVKVDLLAPLPADPDLRRLLKFDSRRVRPLAVERIHAHTTPESITVGEELLGLDLEGNEGGVRVFIPHPFTYLVLKLHAYRDRKDDPETNFGRHHAFDLYRTVAMITEPEWEQMDGLRARHGQSEPIREAARIVHDLFGDETAVGAVALREEARSTGFADLDVRGFLRDMADVLSET